MGRLDNSQSYENPADDPNWLDSAVSDQTQETLYFSQFLKFVNWEYLSYW